MNTTEKDLRKFGITLGIILFLFGLINFLKHHANIYPWFLSFSGISFLLGIFIPKSLKYVFYIFTKFAHIMGWINTRIILIVIFYLLVLPIGMVMKILNKDPLDRKINRHAETYWIPKAQVKANREILERQF